MHRLLLLGATSSMLVFGCSGGEPNDASTGEEHLEATLPSGAPLLRLPFAAGAVVLCQQGNDTGAGHSHSESNTRFALDLSVPGVDEVPIAAGADGKVLRIVTGSEPLAVSPGAGFGNQVAIEHAGGFISVSSHLARVDVQVGASVRAGDIVGLMGNTGKAGNPHLHFSLHRRLPAGDGLIESVPMEGLLAADVTAGTGFAVAPSSAFVCAPSIVSHAGHLYASENRGASAIVGPVPTDLAGVIAPRRAALEHAIDEKIGVQLILDDAETEPPARMFERLSTWLQNHPDDHLARYWVVVYGFRVTPADKERIRTELAILEAAQPENPAWLGPWTLLRSAELAILEGRTDEARELVARADAVEGQGASYDGFVARLQALLAP